MKFMLLPSLKGVIEKRHYFCIDFNYGARVIIFLLRGAVAAENFINLRRKRKY